MPVCEDAHRGNKVRGVASGSGVTATEPEESAMAMFNEILASDFATAILAITSAPLLIGLVAFAVTMGRRTDAALDNAFGARDAKPRPAHRWDRHPVRTLHHNRHGMHAARTNAASHVPGGATEF